MAQKGTDLSCVALCRLHHMEVHSRGKKSFEGKYDITLQTMSLYTVKEYIKEKGL